MDRTDGGERSMYSPTRPAGAIYPRRGDSGGFRTGVDAGIGCGVSASPAGQGDHEAADRF